MTKSLFPRWLAAALLSLAVLALAGVATPARAYDPVDGAVALDPFDPVPEIQFRHYGGNPCFGECRRDDCHHGCYRYRRWRCDEDCERYRCDHDCENHRPCERACQAQRDQHRYEEQADRYDAQADRYEAQAQWYEEEVIDRDGHHHYNFFRDGDHHDGHLDEHHDGDHGGDAHDGDNHDGDHPDVGAHDGPHDDQHGGDHQDGDHHDDQHDDGPHDGIPPGP
ncbi:MAG TPA: hypothetical protein VIJ72_07010 [Rhizomicrobium sp.]